MKWNNIRNSPGIKNISALATSTVTGSIISAVFWLYLADILGQENYGELGYLIAIAGITSNVALIGGEWVMVVYTAKGKNVQPVLYLISLITGGISAVVLYVIFQNAGLSIFVIGFIIFNLTIAEIQGRKLYKSYAKTIILQKIFFVAISFILFQIIGSEGILLGYGLSFILFFKRMYISIKTKNYDFGFIKEKKGFIANNYSLDLTSAIKGQVDKLMIAPMFGFGLLGNYYLGLQVISILSILPGVIFTYILPQDASQKSTHKLRIITILGSIILAALGIFLAPILIPIIFPEYNESISLIPIMSISIIPATISSMYTSKFLGNEKSLYILIGYIISIITLILGILVLGEIFNVTGLAIAYVLSISINAIFLLIINFVKKDSLEKNNNE
jgi:O-antigen/teichoic acid export membrane protein